jgi:drug/metabolite transporter (DMT)-like permease
MSEPSTSQATVVPAPPQGRGHYRADAALFGLTLVWGLTFPLVKEALGEADPFTFLALRFCVGALALTVLVRRQLLAHLRTGAALGLVLFLGFALQTVGLEATTPSRSAFLTGLYVVFVPLLGWGLFRQQLRAWLGVGVVLSAAGLWLLTGRDMGTGPGFGLGEWLTLGCAVAYALHILLIERFAPKEGAAGFTAVQLWVVALLSAACLPFSGARVAWTPSLLGAVAFTGLVASAGAISVQVWAQARTSAVRATLIFALEPVVAAIFSVALGHERLGPSEWSGGGLMLLGVLVAELGPLAWERLKARGQRAGAIPGALP